MQPIYTISIYQHLLSNDQIKIFLYIALTLFITTPLSTHPTPFSSITFLWKSKVMHTGVDITCFFQDVKSSLTKHTVFWKRVMEPVKHLSCSLLQKKLTAYSRKQFPQKKSTLDVWEGSKEYQLLLWWILPQILTPPLNLKIWCRTPAPSLITHPPLSTIKLLRIQISK